jgi:hypothetical protein
VLNALSFVFDLSSSKAAVRKEKEVVLFEHNGAC